MFNEDEMFKDVICSCIWIFWPWYQSINFAVKKKSIYPYEDMNNDWEKLDETPLPEKKHFHGNLNMK